MVQPAPQRGPDEQRRELLRQFFCAQEKRAQAYAQFAHGFRQYQLDSDNNKLFGAVAEAVARDFQFVSQNVRTIEAALRELNLDSHADLLRHVQEGEKQKLNLTVSLQALRKAQAEHMASQKHAPQHPELVPPGGHGCGCCSEDDDAAARMGKCAAALAEATQELQRVTVDINETLEELRYALAEL